jgi:hypothetical protein
MIITPMEVKEHFYSDNPSRAPVDGRTTIPGVEYFFLGNGLIQAAVQISRAGGATPAGLLVMDPERLGPKRRALTFDPVSGIGSTRISIIENGHVHRPRPRSLKARWVPGRNFPLVEVVWRSGPFRVVENFYCPDLETPRLLRSVAVAHLDAGETRVRVRTGVKKRFAEKALTFRGRGIQRTLFQYRLHRRTARGASVRVTPAKRAADVPEKLGDWQGAAVCRLPEPALERFFSAAKFGLRAAVSSAGRLDGGIWQYNLEWVRDQAFIAAALAMSGQFEPARVILDRLLREFVSREGATVDSSRLRSWEECEFDQNGVLLFALENYVNWTGDTSLLRRHRAKITRAADFPLREVFLHRKSGLLSNRREFWERHAAYGIRDGMELAHQLFVSMGLVSAARLSRRMGDARKAASWDEAASRLKKVMLRPGRFSFVRHGRLVKRLDTDGRVQAEIRPPAGSRLPVEAPLFEGGRHLLNPDTSAALPIAWEFIDPAGTVARRTLLSLETLWNQRWTGGGYGRYHVSSEPDSPGPWPFPSLFVARAWFEAGNDRKVRRVLDWLGRLPGSNAGTWLEFYGPRPVPPYPQVGVVPWVWAEMLFLFIHHILGVRPSEKDILFRPRLLRRLPWLKASLRVRGGRLDILLRTARRGEEPAFWTGRTFHPFKKTGIVLPFPADGEALRLEAVLPR